jgi:hypothetical protein
MILFGSYSDYLEAPYDVVLRHTLRLYGKWKAEKEERDEQDQKRALERMH